MKHWFWFLFLAAWLALPAASASGPIHLKTRDLTAADYPEGKAFLTAAQGPGHLLVQFLSAPQADDVRELERRGAKIVGAATENGLLISVAQPTSLGDLAIEWVGPLLPGDKVSPLVSAAADTDPVPVVIEFHPDVPARRALQLLRGANVQILSNRGLAQNHQLVTATPQALAALAGWDEVAYIFPASSDLVEGNRVMACTSALMGLAPAGQYALVNAAWDQAHAGAGLQLGYAFDQMSAKLPAASTESEIVRALQEWAKYANISVGPASTSTALHTLAIRFAEGVHGDEFPFPRGGRVLAHTFFPSPLDPEPLAGQMHFNEDENWQIGSDPDVYTVALHQAGHALGLGHTDDPSAVMYPYYRFGAVLSASDIAAIQALYGGPNTAPASLAGEVLAIAIANPAGGAVTTSALSMALSGTATGGTGPLQVTWTDNQGGSGVASGSAAWSIGAVALSPGANVITVQVTDGAGNTASSSITVTLQVSEVLPPTIPTLPVTPTDPIGPVAPAPPSSQVPPSGSAPPPSLEIVSPGMSISATSLDSISISGTATSGVISVAWSNSTGGSGTAAGTTSWSADIPLLIGTNTITVTALDGSGNLAWRALTVVRQQVPATSSGTSASLRGEPRKR